MGTRFVDLIFKIIMDPYPDPALDPDLLKQYGNGTRIVNLTFQIIMDLDPDPTLDPDLLKLYGNQVKLKTCFLTV
jgi:hypothetical protein